MATTTNIDRLARDAFNAATRVYAFEGCDRDAALAAGTRHLYGRCAGPDYLAASREYRRLLRDSKWANGGAV